VDIGGASMSGAPPLEASRWLPHRLAYQRRADLAGPDGRPARVRAAVLACPPMTMALLRRRAEALTLMLAGLAPIAVVEGLDEPALRQALETHEQIVVRTAGLLCIGPDLASVLNQVETVEHAATVELASERGA